MIVGGSYSITDTVKTMSNNGFIKIHRSILKWEWYTDANTMRLFIHCLLMANHEDNRFRGKIIQRGSFQTSYQMLSDQTGMSIQNIRTALNKLTLTGELTYKSTTQNGLITINNYDDYQATNTQTNKQLTSDQQTTNKRLTTNKNLKNLKNEKNKPLGDELLEMIEAYTDNPELLKALNEFVEHRNSNDKTKLTKLALTKNLNLLTSLFGENDTDKIKSIDQSIANNWRGIFPIDSNKKQGKKSPIEMLEESEWML